MTERAEPTPAWLEHARRQLEVIAAGKPRAAYLVLRAAALLVSAERDRLPPPKLRYVETGAEGRIEIHWSTTTAELLAHVQPGRYRVRLWKTDAPAEDHRYVGPRFRDDWRALLHRFTPEDWTEAAGGTLEMYFGEP